MWEQTKISGAELQERLASIETLISQQKYSNSLKELKLLENEIDIKDLSSSTGKFYHLSAITLYHLGNYPEAKYRSEKALTLLRETNDNSLLADTENILGRTFLSLGDLKSAELHLRDAIATYRRLGDQGQVCNIYNIIARINFIRSDFPKALELLKEALHTSMEIKGDKLVAHFTSNLGRVYTLVGQWEKAEESLLIGLKYYQEKKTELNICRDKLALGYLYSLKRNFNKAHTLYGQALQLREKNNWIREQVIYHEYAGELAYYQGQFSVAEAHYKKIIEIMSKIAPDSDMINQTYRLFAVLQFAKKEYVKGLSSCVKSLKVSRSLGDRLEEGAVYRILGQIYSAQGEKNKSKKYFTKGISILQGISAKYELAKTYLEAGKSTSFDYYQRLGFLMDAEREFKGLKVNYYLAQVDVAIAQLLFENEEWNRVPLFLDRAENLFRESEDEKGLIEIARIRQNIQDVKNHKFLSVETTKKGYVPPIKTRNSKILDIIEKIHQIKDSDVNIFLEGETGTGKDLLAKFIHYKSDRKDKKFVAVNCSALPESLLENELFGHKKGAYTGATQDQWGRFEEAEGGTLYLDEIADVPLPIQVKLLRATENKEITRLGDTKPRRIDVRLISSTNRDIQKAIEDGSFRQDLYHRLNTIPIKIPPLRERKEDIPLLFKHFLEEFGVGEELLKSIENPVSLIRLIDYEWPGNIRELENEVKRIAVLSGGDKCRFCHLLNSFHQEEGETEVDSSLPSRVAKFEKAQILNALLMSDWVKTKAAALLGIDESLLRYKIKKH
ncbi:MAG: sigma 54-interacting transcriptional regulator [Candidatus Zixiibacteriota bacterium]